MAATIKMVAERAGVSVATVSKYINGGNVYEENRRKVQKAIDELDYKINDVARSLKTNKTYTVGVLAANIRSTFLTAIISKIQNTLLTRGYSTIIADYQEDKELERKQLEVLLKKHVDGIILFPENDEMDIVEMIRSRKIPLVLVDNIVKGCACDAVLTDNIEGAYAAVEELIRHNHRRIGIINGPDSMSSFEERLKGYTRALQDYFIEIDEKLIIKGLHNAESGYEGMIQLLDMKNPPSAVFVSNYHMSLGALKALFEKKIKIPEQMSIITFDYLEFGFVMDPVISNIIQPQEEMGERAARKLLQRINGDYANYPQIERLKTIHSFTGSIGNWQTLEKNGIKNREFSIV